MTYQEFKEFIAENKDKAVVALGFVLMFLVGFGVGSYKKTSTQYKPTQTNYTTNSKVKPTVKSVETDAQVLEKTTDQPQVLGEAVPAVAAPSSTTPSQKCLIKGNISSGSKKIYHMPGGAFYKIVKPEMCFNTEAEAKAAGFVKSGR